MAWTRPRTSWSQGIVTGGIIGLSAAVMCIPLVQSVWSKWVGATPDWFLIIVVPILLHHPLYWVLALFFHHVDRTDRPEWVARYRIQTGAPRRPPLPRVVKNLLWNQIVWTPVSMGIIWVGLDARGWTADASLPDVWTLLYELIGLSVCSVVYFYASHRLLHQSWWMKHVHRVHHEFRTTTTMASEYAHPVEFVFGNFGTLGCGVLLLAPSLPAIYVFTVVSMLTILSHHSGYAIPLLPAPAHHDWHHWKFHENFGTVGVLDRLLGTDRAFRTLQVGDTVGPGGSSGGIAKDGDDGTPAR